MKRIGNKSMQTNFPTCVNVSTYSKGDKSCLTCLMMILLNIKSKQECFESTILDLNDVRTIVDVHIE
jgi:hypothetical protein